MCLKEAGNRGGSGPTGRRLSAFLSYTSADIWLMHFELWICLSLEFLCLAEQGFVSRTDGGCPSSPSSRAAPCHDVTCYESMVAGLSLPTTVTVSSHLGPRSVNAKPDISHPTR